MISTSANKSIELLVIRCKLLIQMTECYAGKRSQPCLKIVDFIANLYKRYKVLDKLTHQQSVLFQEEVRSMLTDQNENVDQQLHKSIESDMGIPSFVLEILANVVTRNPIKNQFQINRSIASISDQLQKKHIQLNKKIKMLERRQEKLTQMQNSLLSTIKEKCLAMENQSMQRLMGKENEIKRAFNALGNQLKAKEKILLERLQEIKAQSKKIAEMEQKERGINEKMRVLDRREKDLKSKDYEGQISKLEKEIKSHKNEKESLTSAIAELSKKLKNLDLAYKKVKAEIAKKEAKQVEGAKQELKQQEIEVKPRKEVPAIKNRPAFENLNISQIDAHEQPDSQEEDEDEESMRFDEDIKLNLGDDPEQNALDGLIRAMQEQRVESEEDKMRLLKSNRLQTYIEKCREYRLNREMCIAAVELMLSLLQARGECYGRIVQMLSQEGCLQFLQQIYLSHETCDDIVETASLILSRIRLHCGHIQLQKPFAKALQIRMKADNASSFIANNIKSILC